MAIFFISEQSPQGGRKTRYRIEASNLCWAKRYADLKQAFDTDIIEIMAESGFVLSVKKDGKWTQRN